MALYEYEPSTPVLCIAWTCMIWYTFIVLVQIIGTTQLFRHYTFNPALAISSTLPIEQIPHITVIRPVKGLEPQLYECLAATFRQDYPSSNLSVRFCISSLSDPAHEILKQLVADFPGFDVKIYVEEEDPNLSGRDGETTNLGPNPKIRNMSRAYRESASDVIWVLDCNVWIGRGVAGRMIDTLCGFRGKAERAMPFKFVHQIPLVVDWRSTKEEERALLGGYEVSSSSTAAYDIYSPAEDESPFSQVIRRGGGRLEEQFMATSHAKFYTAINTVGVAPCIVGKSNMFRRSHLNALTSTSSSSEAGSLSYGQGIDFFSNNICEDHLIGDLLWRKKIPEELSGQKWGKHGIVFGDMAIQPMASMSVNEYIARRIRWLRVRKWTVTLATLVEPGVESLLCSAYGAFAITTLPWFNKTLGTSQTWWNFAFVWCLSVICWITVDWNVYAKLHSCGSVEQDMHTPSFARPPTNLNNKVQRRPFKEWMGAWLGRELLALPIWITAVWGGTTVVWRSRTFWVGMDMKVHEIGKEEAKRSIPGTPEVIAALGKDRVD